MVDYILCKNFLGYSYLEYYQSGSQTRYMVQNSFQDVLTYFFELDLVHLIDAVVFRRHLINRDLTKS